MNIQENISLLPFNTFGIDKNARFFAVATSTEEVKQLIQKSKEMNVPLFILGGGSNILLTKNLEALVMKIEIKGFELIEEDENGVLVKVGAGESWHEFVLYCIQKNWGGVENLSLIPGTVGASPMQNIGAYGIEIKEVFDHLEAINRNTNEVRKFYSEECKFGYRESVFKNDLKEQYVITHVVFRLSKSPVIHAEYGAIRQTLKEKGIESPTIKDISDAVIDIRRSKLPDPAHIGNAGSFFKNPTVPVSIFENIKSEFPNVPGFPNEEGVKIPAAWLIEQTGWKGKKFGNIGVHQFQPLVLVNYGGGEGNDIKELSLRIQESVLNKFNVPLQPEVNFL
ncbi:UDP-N-acetylmuramate dehydrogenase [Aquiflexum gelatinilyticum]|uniref:UDP-N-acetylenolpyruvoylglucosamine reductase n=1 Tax=Aquiflexum gelatinilyticum TaxID=2961943 RepID=A0A9X2T4J8_9BACT|nr:UDP-N-acetylmuramate dehydrogenase [Aquiflexum gelatinilyticum]MCR9017390.1 UDP-N-acetylmuramate dehydrogenase [Aquiflexum gelatinilyticum]